MSRKATRIILSPEERAVVDEWARSRTMPLRVVQRAKIIHLASNGMDSQDIAKVAQIGAPRKIYFEPKNRFVAEFVGTINRLRARPITVSIGYKKHKYLLYN